MCMLSFSIVFATAHIIAWFALGGGWRGAARAPLAVFVPAAAFIALNGVMDESYVEPAAQLATLVSWEAGYFFLYVCLRLSARAVEPLQLEGPRK